MTCVCRAERVETVLEFPRVWNPIMVFIVRARIGDLLDSEKPGAGLIDWEFEDLVSAGAENGRNRYL